MRRNARFLGFCVFFVLSAFAAGARGVETGQGAPPFELPMIIGGGSVNSDRLFEAHRRTFLVFWGSGCSHCVEALRRCEDFNRRYGGEEIAVVGITAAEGDLLPVRRILESSGVRFPQLLDAGGSVTGSYAVPFATFAVYLVARDGTVIGVEFDPRENVASAMEKMLETGESAGRPRTTFLSREPGDTTLAGSEAGAARRAVSGFSFAGKERIRFLSIDSRGLAAVGPYGESIVPGNKFDYRFELEMTKRVRGNLRLGGLLRIGNEGERVLEAGPQYLGSEWGSAFAEIETARLGLRLGYYSISMTPFTLMRWDWDDSPRAGGDAGCGCGGAAGTLLIEGLDELRAELVFEGAIARFSAADFEARVFYAMPRRAAETYYLNYRSGMSDRAHYSMEIYGIEGRWQRFDTRTASFWRAGLHGVGKLEDRRSVDFSALGYPAADPWSTGGIITASGEIPVVRYVRLRGEVVTWNESVEHGVASLERPQDVSRRGSGGIGGVVFEESPDLSVAVDYLRLDEDFVAPFSALSYEPNREGLRASVRLPMPLGVASLSLFYKRLGEVRQPLPTMERKQTELSGVALDFTIVDALGAGLGWLEDKSWRRGAVLPSDTYRRALTASARYDLGKGGVLELQYQKVTSRDTSVYLATESKSDLYMVLSTVSF